MSYANQKHEHECEYENIVTEIKKCCMEISHIIHNGNSSKLGSSIPRNQRNWR